ncbi:MAG: methanogenesis marker 12 protein [Candidatus Methanospirare jalkutatii]|nr:methanogenesis marker 12 protein [Candidatus Methanospirare jalkutatii]
MFIGIDHGTTGIRFALLSGSASENSARIYEISRERVASLREREILREIEHAFGVKLSDVRLVAVSYSMGDGISKITDLHAAKNRGLREEIAAAGLKVGGGTRVFDAIKSSGVPAVLIPGIHADLQCLDRRMRFFSHGASPEKVGIAYYIFKRGFKDFIFSDVSSNTVSVAVVGGEIVGAIDACIFAPGLIQGPLDLQLLRDVQKGLLSANEAFSSAGVLRKFGFQRLTAAETQKQGQGRRKGKAGGAAEGASDAFETLALFVAMEISALLVLLRDLASTAKIHIFLTGSVGESEKFRRSVDDLLRKLFTCEEACKEGGEHCFSGVEVQTLTRHSAAIGCAEIARDVFNGQKRILGIEVDWKVRKVLGKERNISSF